MKWKGLIIGGRLSLIWAESIRRLPLTGIVRFIAFSTFLRESISENDLNNREEILKFKEGGYSLMAQLLTDFINGNFRRDRIASWVLCAIPASTIQKHRLRYSALLKTVSDETGIRNGIDFIRPKYDRKDSRQQKEANTIRNLEFDRQQIHGNWIILIDDVTTKGTSFVQCVNKLYACGAKYVCGVFMGKTVDL